jgi:hypothetical protein
MFRPVLPNVSVAQGLSLAPGAAMGRKLAQPNRNGHDNGQGLAVSGLALFVIGSGTSLFTGRGWLFSGFRQLLIGFTAAAITFGVGRLIGVSVSG